MLFASGLEGRLLWASFALILRSCGIRSAIFDGNVCGSLLVVAPLEGGSMRCHVPDLVLAVHAGLTPLEPVCATLLPPPLYDYFLV